MTARNLGTSVLVVQAVFYADGSDGPPTAQPINKKTLPGLGQLLPSLSTSFAPLLPYLTTSLVSQFNAGWSASDASELLESSFTTALQQNGVNVSRVTASVPEAGTLWADVIRGSEATSSDPATPPQLVLTFNTPGCFISYQTPSVVGQAEADAASFGLAALGTHLRDEWTVSFDFQIVFTSSVPNPPFSLDFSSIGQSANADNKPENDAAAQDDAADFILVLLGDIANSLGFYAGSSTAIPQSVQPTASQQLQSGLDSDQTAIPGGLGVNELADTLNKAGAAHSPPNIVTYGFSQCDFSVMPNGSTAILTLTITHPLDPAPVLQDLSDPSNSTAPVPPRLGNPPRLSASATTATAGTAIVAVGNQFPLDTATQANLQWDNSSTGIPTGAQVKVNGGTPMNVPPSSSPQNIYTYTSTNLQPNTIYEFEVRCADEVSFSRWTPVLSVKTAAVSTVELSLNSVTQPIDALFPLGSASLSTSSENWLCKGVIPPSTPVGAYNLTAALDGKIVASVPLSVALKLDPEIHFVDPTNRVIVLPPLLGGSVFALEGVNFSDGPVLVSIDGQIVARPTAVNGAFLLPNLKAPGDEYFVGVVTVTALGADGSALPLSFLLQGQPK